MCYFRLSSRNASPWHSGWSKAVRFVAPISVRVQAWALAKARVAIGLARVEAGALQQCSVDSTPSWGREAETCEAADMLRQDICFEIDGLADSALEQLRTLAGVRDDRHAEAAGPDRVDGQRYPVDRDRALGHDLGLKRAGHAVAEIPGITAPVGTDQLAHRVDVAADPMAAESIAEAQRSLEIDLGARGQGP